MRTTGRLALTGIVLFGVVVTVACSGGSTSNGDSTADGGVETSDGSPGTEPTGTGDAGKSMTKDAGAPIIACKTAADCPSKICLPNNTCAAPTCSDGVQNQTETDIDCGGTCAACDVLKKCKVGADCTSKVCKDIGAGLECQAPTSTDGVQNGNETDVDCGGAGNPACASGKDCKVRSDCSSDVCTGGKCVTPVCNDGAMNGMETGIDCGGPDCPRCGDDQGCKTGDDCTDGVCADVGAGLQCQPPSYTDGVKNGTETDVDCGGTGDPTMYGCAPSKSCIADTDCTSDGCDYTKHCAVHRSCTGNSTGGRYGADTCGTGGPGGLGAANWESCCATVDVTVTEGTPAVQQTVHLDKYKVTAGRMRAFLESVNGDVRTFVTNARAAGQIPNLPVPSGSAPAATTVLPPAWDIYLPTSMDGDPNETPDCDQGGWDATNLVCKDGSTYAPMYTSAANHVGPTIFKANSQTLQGCEYNAPGTHTYFLGAKDYWGVAADFDQTIYDQKPLQCVDYVLAQAFCVWDGGRLETTQEWYATWEAAPRRCHGHLLRSWIAAVRPRLRSFQRTDLPSANPVACPTPGAVSTVCDANVNGGKCGTNSMCTPPATYTACRFPDRERRSCSTTPAYVSVSTGCGFLDRSRMQHIRSNLGTISTTMSTPTSEEQRLLRLHCRAGTHARPRREWRRRHRQANAVRDLFQHHRVRGQSVSHSKTPAFDGSKVGLEQPPARGRYMATRTPSTATAQFVPTSWTSTGRWASAASTRTEHALVDAHALRSLHRDIQGFASSGVAFS